MIQQPPSTSPRHRKKRRSRHHRAARWQRWKLRLLVGAFIVVAAMIAYWMAEHVNQRPAPSEDSAVITAEPVPA